jgi:hypothetical protein
MNISKQRLILYFPYVGVGGVPVLFLRLSEFISSKGIYDVCIVDYKDGYMSCNYNKKSNITLIEYNDSENIYFQETDIVVFQSMPLRNIPTNLIFCNENKIIYWTLHPYNMFHAARLLKTFKNKLLYGLARLFVRHLVHSSEIKTVKQMNKSRAIFFMDGENLSQTERLLDVTVTDPIYMPLIIDGINNTRQNHDFSKDEIRCAWVGRIADFKVHILVYTLIKLDKIVKNTGVQISFEVVGTGEYLTYLLDRVSCLKNIDIIYTDYIAPKDFSEFLKNIDVGFGMGTSALDFAMYGVPTVLLDGSYEEIKEGYKFGWLYDTENYTLAKLDRHSFEIGNDSLQLMMGELNDNYQEFCLRSINYVENNYNPLDNVDKFLSLVGSSNLKYGDIDNKLFSMKFAHKVLGLKKYGE